MSTWMGTGGIGLDRLPGIGRQIHDLEARATCTAPPPTARSTTTPMLNAAGTTENLRLLPRLAHGPHRTLPPVDNSRTCCRGWQELPPGSTTPNLAAGVGKNCRQGRQLQNLLPGLARIAARVDNSRPCCRGWQELPPGSTTPKLAAGVGKNCRKRVPAARLEAAGRVGRIGVC